jgi:hypothetical protein
MRQTTLHRRPFAARDPARSNGGEYRGKTKPDLMAEAASRLASSKRILAQLEHGTQTHRTGWTIDGWTIALFVLLSMCSVAAHA